MIQTPLLVLHVAINAIVHKVTKSKCTKLKNEYQEYWREVEYCGDTAMDNDPGNLSDVYILKYLVQDETFTCALLKVSHVICSSR